MNLEKGLWFAQQKIMSPKEKYSLKKTCFSLPLYCLDNLRSTNTKYLNTSIIKTWPQRSFISRHIIISEAIWFPMVLFLPKKENEHLSCFRTQRDFMYLLCMHFNITINYLCHFHYKLQKQDIFLRTIFKNLYVMLSLASKQHLVCNRSSQSEVANWQPKGWLWPTNTFSLNNPLFFFLWVSCQHL